MLDTKAQWETDNADAIEEYNRYTDRERRRTAGEPVSEDEEDEEAEDGKAKEPPAQPIFDEKEALSKFDGKEENAIVEIPKAIVDDIDGDWVMTPEEEQDFIDRTI